MQKNYTSADSIEFDIKNNTVFLFFILLTLFVYSIITIIINRQHNIVTSTSTKSYSIATLVRIPFINDQSNIALLNKALKMQGFQNLYKELNKSHLSSVRLSETNGQTQPIYIPIVFATKITYYYVDSSCAVNGNGKTEICGINGPFNSLENAQWSVTGNQSNNYLLLRRGQIYYGQFDVQAYGTAGNPFIISSYGTGARPIITGGKTNIIVDCTNCQYIIIDDIEFSYSEDEHNVLINYPASHITIQNSYSHNANGSGITIYNSSNNIVVRNEVSWNGRDGIVIAKGDSPQPTNNNVIMNNSTHNNLRYGILVKSIPAYPLEAYGTKIHHNQTYNNSTGIYLVSSNRIEIFDNIINNNGKDCQGTDDCPGEDYGFAIQSGSYNEFHDNFISGSHNTGVGIFGSQEYANGNSDGNRIYRNVVSNTIMGYWMKDIDFQCYPGNSVGYNNLIYNNIVWGDGLNFVIGDSNPNVNGNAAYNNIFYGGSTGVTFSDNTANTGWIFINNIIAGNSHYSINAYQRVGLTLINNIYHKPSGGTLVKYNNTSYNSENIYNIDSNARVTDPMFFGTSNWSDFRLQPSSPAIDAGVNLGSPFNLVVDPMTNIWPPSIIDQNSCGSGWEIGAFGYIH